MEKLEIILLFFLVTNITLVGPTEGQGRVEVLKNGVWGTVCDERFDADDAKVICSMVYPNYDVHVPCVEGVFGNGSGEIHFEKLNCNGSETSLDSCQFNNSHKCFHSEDAGVICDSMAMNIRLVGGSADALSGRLEVQLNGEWGTVCDDGFNTVNAKVACKTLGLPYDNAYVSTFGAGTGKIFFDDVRCIGTESTLLECKMAEVGNNNCAHTEDVGVICTDQIPNVQVRLVGGSTAYEGLVEVNVNGQWGTICDDLWDEQDAKVVCRMLGYNGTAFVVGNAYFGSGGGRILMDDVQCNGSEQNIAECPFGGYGVEDCTHLEDAGVICNGGTTSTVLKKLTTCENGCSNEMFVYIVASLTQVRLVGGNIPSEGRVEILYNNIWGTVCDDSFDELEAKVICNNLGFNTSTSVALGGAFFGEGRGPIHMDELACKGNEESLALCRFNGFDVEDCDHSEDASVICNTDVLQNLTLRLVGGKTSNEGRLEVFYHKQWGTVCDDDFGRESARVVCGMLGLPADDPQAIRSAFFGEGTGPIWLDNLRCVGNETSIEDCHHNIFGFNNCQHSEDVGVRCGESRVSPLRLVGGVGPFEGRLEVFHDNKWGTVCADSFGLTEAKVVCNAVGYPSVSPVVHQSREFGSGIGDVWLSGVQCTGNEPALDLCIHDRWGTSTCGHEKDVGIICSNHGLMCYHCDGLKDPMTCNETIQCAVGEACSETAYTIYGETRVSMACQSQLVCDALASVSSVGKRSVRQTSGQATKVKCCHTALCNRDVLTLGNHPTPSGTTTCGDKPGTDCAALDALSICDNSQEARLLCPRHCGLCT